MTWAIFNALTQGARPVWLLRVIRGGITTYVTNASADVTTGIGVPDATFLAPTVWTSTAVKIGAITDSNTLKKQNTVISFPRKNTLAQAFLAAAGIVSDEITVWQGFATDPDDEFLQLFKGNVEQVRPSWRTVELHCVNASMQLANTAIARVAQAPCPHMVFDAMCGAVRADFQEPGQITAITTDGLILTISEAAAFADGYFRSSVVYFGAEIQAVTSHYGDQLTLAGTLVGVAEELLASGFVNVLLSPGCRKSITYCSDIFANEANHGGFPYLDKSPYEGGGIL